MEQAGLRRAVATLSCALSLGLADAAMAQQHCAPDERERVLPAAGQAVARWENAHRTALTEAARELVLGQFCAEAMRLNREDGVAFSDINDAAGQVLGEHLGETASAAAMTRPLEDLLAARFALNAGPIMPGPRALGRIRLNYRQPTDSLQVGRTRLPPHPQLIAETGPVSIIGFAAARVVCRGNVTVVAALEVTFTC